MMRSRPSLAVRVQARRALRLLTILLFDDEIDDELLIVCVKLIRATYGRVPVPLVDNTPEHLPEQSFAHIFRFTHGQFDELVAFVEARVGAMVVRVDAGRPCSFRTHEGMLALCARMSSTSSLVRLEYVLGIAESTISRRTRLMANAIHAVCAPRLTYNRNYIRSDAARWAAAVSTVVVRNDGTNGMICAFGDGTLQPIARPAGPDLVQRAVYTRRKHGHVYNYMCVSDPVGIIVACAGPFSGAGTTRTRSLSAAWLSSWRKTCRTSAWYGRIKDFQYNAGRCGAVATATQRSYMRQSQCDFTGALGVASTAVSPCARTAAPTSVAIEMSPPAMP